MRWSVVEGPYWKENKTIENETFSEPEVEVE